MTSKYTLILFTILLATAAISGCTDADAPETLFNEQAIQELIDDGTPINDVNDMISAVADLKNYDVDVVKSDSTGKIVSIGVDDDKGNHVRFINDDDKSDVDRATLNGKQIYPTTGEATSTQTQLADEPTTNNQALYTQITNSDVIRGAFDKDINLYRIPASVLGAPDREASNGNTWLDVAGFDKYIEYIDETDRVEKIEFNTNYGDIIVLFDKEKNDGKIDIIEALLSNDEFISLP